MVTLTNTSRRMKVYNLDHPFFRTSKWGARRMAVTVVEQHRDGNRYPKVLKRSLPGSITLLAGESRKGLPDQIKAVPAIRKDLKSGVLVSKKVEESPPPKPESKPKAKRRSGGES